MKLAAALVVGLTLLAGPATASTVNIYKAGCSNATHPARDANGVPLSCSSTIEWTDVIGPDPIVSATISIVAEGIDYSDPSLNERDAFYVNDTHVGFLTQQGFYSRLFRLQPGPGALVDVTWLSLSIFDITSYLHGGSNSFKVVMDRNNWVNEIETATLDTTPVPEPASFLLLGSGLLARAWRARRRTAR